MPIVMSPFGMEVEDIGPGVTIGSQDSPVAVAPAPAPAPVPVPVAGGAPQMLPPEVRYYDGYSALVNGGVPGAVQRSGSYYSPAGMREGAELYGIAPAIRQTQPYATATARVRDADVENLYGYPSVYPHVLRGYSRTPMERLMPWIQSMMPAWWNERPGQMPATAVRRGAVVASSGNGGGVKKNTASTTGAVPFSNKMMLPPEIRYGGYPSAPVQASASNGVTPKAAETGSTQRRAPMPTKLPSIPPEFINRYMTYADQYGVSPEFAAGLSAAAQVAPSVPAREPRGLRLAPPEETFVQPPITAVRPPQYGVTVPLAAYMRGNPQGVVMQQPAQVILPSALSR